MTHLSFLPISIDELHENTIECLIVTGVMLRDFGPWKRGQSICLTFDFSNGTVTHYDDDGQVLDRVVMRLEA